MSKTTSIVIGILVAGALIVTLFDGSGSNSNKKLTTLFDADKSSSVSSITITNRVGNSLELLRSESNSWRISKDQFPVDASKILKFLDKLSQVKVVRKIGSSPTNLEALGLDQPVKLVLKSKSKPEELLSLDIGSARKGGGSYISFAGKKDVYLLSQTLDVFTDIDEWELKRLVALKKEDIQEVEFSSALKVQKASAENEYVLVNTPPEQTDNNKIGASFAVFSNLNYTKRFLRSEAIPQKALTLAHAVIVKNVAGSVYKFRVGKFTPPKTKAQTKDGKPQAQVTEDRWFVSLSVDFSEKEKAQAAGMKAMTEKWVFEVAPYYGRQFVKQKTDFMKPPAPPKNQTPPKKSKVKDQAKK